jgi:SSS family transporter
MTPLDWILVVGYLGSLIGFGIFLSKRQEDEESFFLGGRNMPWFAVSMSIVATSLSAGSFVGLPQVSYLGNLTYLMIPIGSTIGGILAAVLLVPTLYRAGTLTIYGYLKNRFGPRAELASSWFFIVGLLLAQGARHFIASIVVALMLFGNSDLPSLIGAIVILGVIATVYTAAGGIHAVIWTDVMQVCILIVAGLICVVYLYLQIPLDIGGIIDVLRTAPEGDKLHWWTNAFRIDDPYTFWAAVGAYGLMNVAQYGCDQDMVQRMMTCKSPTKATWSMILSRAISIPIILLLLAIGLLLYVFYARPDIMGTAAPFDTLTDTRNVFPQFILAHLPRGIVGLAVAGLLAASMSSFDSAANAMASTIQGNLRREQRRGHHTLMEVKAEKLVQSRRTVYYMGAGLTVFAILAAISQRAGGQGLIDFSLGVLTFSYAGLFGVFVTAIMTSRGNEKSAVRALWTGAIAVLMMQPYILRHWSSLLFEKPLDLAWPWWFLVGAVFSFAVCVTGKPESAKDLPPV